MGKIKEFLNGFRKLEYTYELAGKPDQFKIPVEVLADISREVGRLPVMNLKFKILDIDIRKDLHSYYGISTAEFSRTPYTKYFVKVSKNRYRKEDIKQTEFVVDTVANFLGIDDEIWTVEISILITCGTFNAVFDDEIVNIAIAVSNSIIRDDLKLRNMTQEGISFPNIHELRSKHSAFTTGMVRTYSTFEHPFEMGKAIPSYLHSEASVSFENIFTAILEDEEDGKNGIFKVLRKEK